MKKYSKIFMLIAILAMVFSFSMGALAAAGDPLETTYVDLRFGDPAYPPTPPESLMNFVAAGGNVYDADYTGTDDTYYYPDTLAFYLTPKAGATITLNSTGVDFIEYSEDGVPSVIPTPITNPAGFYVIKIDGTSATRQIVVTPSSGPAITVRFDVPKSENPGGTESFKVNGYLPVGQYAQGFLWGSISTDNLNSLLDPSKVKGPNGYVATGISLGSLGGYVQYELNTPITDDNKNPYGIDFIVYGNPFNGNPEAGAVQVATKGVDGKPDQWYELAGSLYYDAATERNLTVSWQRDVANNRVDYKLNSGAWTPFVGSKAIWWPNYHNSPSNPKENYGHASGIVSGKITGLTYPNDDSIITYSGVTKVLDDEQAGITSPAAATNDYYSYGYVDIRGIGSKYGTAINPYATAPSTGPQDGAGGDGFDLAWAVNIATGEPENLSGKEIHFVRVYTAVLFNAGVFNETSTEVLGFYRTANKAGSAVGTANPPSVSLDGVPQGLVAGDNRTLIDETGYGNSVTITASGAANIFLNNTKTGSLTVDLSDGEDHYVRVLAQDNTTKQPFLVVYKFSQ